MWAANAPHAVVGNTESVSDVIPWALTGVSAGIGTAGLVILGARTYLKWKARDERDD